MHGELAVYLEIYVGALYIHHDTSGAVERRGRRQG